MRARVTCDGGCDTKHSIRCRERYAGLRAGPSAPVRILRKRTTCNDQCTPTRHSVTCAQRTRRAADDNLIRHENLLRNYGITLEQYEAMREAQGRRCAICGRHEDAIPGRKATGRPRLDGQPLAAPAKLMPDHCHAEGNVRGLLCHWCNVGLGYFEDNPIRLERAAAYLLKSLDG